MMPDPDTIDNCNCFAARAEDLPLCKIGWECIRTTNTTGENYKHFVMVAVRKKYKL